jgi:hypothetical protein
MKFSENTVRCFKAPTHVKDHLIFIRPMIKEGVGVEILENDWVVTLCVQDMSQLASVWKIILVRNCWSA